MNQSPTNSLQQTFKALDRQNTGLIDKETLKEAIMYTGENYDKQIINEQISKCPDKIPVERFIQIFQLAEIQRNQRIQLQSLFKLYDRSGKGFIDANDLTRVAQITGVPLDKNQMQQMLISETQQGKVQLSEFMEIMNDQNLWF